MAADRTVCLIAGMLSKPIPKQLEIYSIFGLKEMNAINVALAMVPRSDLPRVEVSTDSCRDRSAARQNIEGRMTNDDRTCGTAAAARQSDRRRVIHIDVRGAEPFSALRPRPPGMRRFRLMPLRENEQVPLRLSCCNRAAGSAYQLETRRRNHGRRGPTL